jgi:hypothetical protein
MNTGPASTAPKQAEPPKVEPPKPDSGTQALDNFLKNKQRPNMGKGQPDKPKDKPR